VRSLIQSLNILENAFLYLFLLLVPVYRWLPIYSNIVAADLAFAALVVMLAVRFFLTGDSIKLKPRHVIAICLVLVWYLLALIFSSSPLNGIDNILQYSYLVLIFLFFKNRGVRESDIHILFIGACVFTFYCLGELILTPIIEGGRYVFGGRFLREATHPQIIVSALCPISIVLWGYTKKLSYALCSLILYLLLIFSFSRGGLIAIHLVLLFMLFNQRTRKIGLVVWCFIFIVIFLLRSIIGPENFVHFFLRLGSIFAIGDDKTFDGLVISAEHGADRFALIKTVFFHSLDWRMIWGHGLDSFVSDVAGFGGLWVGGDEFAKMSTHNLLTMLLYEQGIVGCLIVFFFLTSLIIRLLGATPGLPLKYAFIFSIIALAINSNTDPGVLVERITWVILGMAAGYKDCVFQPVDA